MTKKKYDAVATIGEYTNGRGEKKKRYLNVGVVFENDKGQLSMKLDALPLVRDWSGFINFYDPKETTESTPASRSQNTRPPEDDDEDIPF